MKRFPASGEKASGAFRMQALGTIQPLIEGRIKDLTCGKSTITPDEMLNKNTILAMDTLTYGKGGLAMNLLISWLLMEALLRRKGDFGFFGLCLDEYHQLCHAERDTQAQAIGRSQKFISIKAFQSLSVLETALGGGVEAQTQAKALYGLPVNKFMMNSNDHFTNEFNSMVIGQEKQMFFGAGQRADSQLEWYDVLGVGARMDFNFSQNWHYRVPPTDFMKLRTGGKENDYIVDCIYHRGFDDFYRLSFTQEFY
ncbi:MAG: TraM recognition domain-containing protein [Planctomycetota bacterium]